jgi:hypothetical protein
MGNLTEGLSHPLNELLAVALGEERMRGRSGALGPDGESYDAKILSSNECCSSGLTIVLHGHVGICALLPELVGDGGDQLNDVQEQEDIRIVSGRPALQTPKIIIGESSVKALSRCRPDVP